MPVVEAQDVIQELTLNPRVFDFDETDSKPMIDRVAEAIRQQEALVLRKVGSSNFNNATEPTLTCIATGTLYRVCAAILQQVINIIAHVPQNVINEVADLAQLETSLERYREEADDFLVAYYTSTDENPVIAFAIGSAGVDERGTSWRGVPTEEFEGKDEDVSDEAFLEG